MNTLNDIISVKELKSKIDQDKSFEEALIKSEIRRQAFTMNNIYKPTTEISKYLKVGYDMGFNIAGNRIDFDLIKPGTEANDIMNEVNEFKNDIIDQVNSGIKQWTTSKENKINVFINLNKLLNKYKVDRLPSSVYSFTWLSSILKQAGYNPDIHNFSCDNDNIIGYSVILTWE